MTDNMKEWKPQTFAERIVEILLAVLALAGILVPCGISLVSIIYIAKLIII